MPESWGGLHLKNARYPRAVGQLVPEEEPILEGKEVKEEVSEEKEPGMDPKQSRAEWGSLGSMEGSRKYTRLYKDSAGSCH